MSPRPPSLDHRSSEPENYIEVGVERQLEPPQYGKRLRTEVIDSSLTHVDL